MNSESDATKALQKVVVRLVEWHEECMRVDHRSPLSEGMISEAQAALELGKRKNGFSP